MTQSNFNACLAHVLQWEGGYVDHPRDPGGATNMGITHKTLENHRRRPVTKAEVRNLTKEEAGQIYRKSYWNAVRGDDLPPGLDLVAFDAGVNSGPRRGIRWLQKGLGVAVDGVIGPKTLRAAKNADAVAAIKRACAARMGFLKRLGTWGTFGRGWTRRVDAIEAAAVAMVVPHPSAHLAAEATRAVQSHNKDLGGAATSLLGAVGLPFFLTGTGAAPFVLDSELPKIIVIAVIIAAVLGFVIFTARAKRNRDRARAYQKESHRQHQQESTHA